jgi:ubiquinone/menaquinone biosynthesis C-methylase UbiE
MTTAKKKTAKTVTPEKFLEDLWAARNTYALLAAIELDVFTGIAKGKQTASEIAQALKASKGGVERLLDSLTALDYLTKKGGRYRLTPASDAFLVRGRQTYIGDLAEESRMTLPGWAKLAEVIRSGHPVMSVDSEAEGRQLFPDLVRSIFPMSYGAASALVKALPARKKKGWSHILDVAAGAAPWSLPFAQALPNVRVSALDYPEVTAVAREYAQRFGVADRYDYVDGTLQDTDFGEKQYDLVILGHIIHALGDSWGKKLIQKSYRALKPGGMLLIAEMVPNDQRSGPPIPVLFGLNMLLHTSDGNVYTMAEYRQWLREAGFSSIKTVDAPSPSPLVVATRS